MNEQHCRIRALLKHACLWAGFAICSVASATPLSLAGFTLENTNADGTVATPSVFSPGDSSSFDLTGGNTGTGLGGITDFVVTAPSDGTLTFLWSYTSCQPLTQPTECDYPGYDWSGYVLDQTFTMLTDTDTGGLAYTATVSVKAGASFGWYVQTFDNFGGPGTLSVFSADFASANIPAVTPEPQSVLLGITGIAMIAWTVGRKTRRTL